MAKENKYNELINFLCTFDKVEGGKSLFSELELFFNKKLSTEKPLFFAKPKDGSKIHDKEISSYCRVLWNRGMLGKGPYENEIIELNLLKVIDGKSILNSWKEYDTGSGYYYSFYCGHSSKQIYFGLVFSKEKIIDEVLDYLVKYLGTFNGIIQSFRSLKKTENLIYIDDVTGLYNQRKLFLDIDESIRKHKEMKEEFSVLFIDVDHFKEVNDGHGHLVGTDLLAQIAILLKKVLRETDMIYRYGGDEFVMIIPDSNIEIAKVVGTRILNAVKRHTFTRGENEGESLKLSVSIGVAGFPSDAKTREDILEMADKMMYEAKKAGRGQVCHAGKMISGKAI